MWQQTSYTVNVWAATEWNILVAQYYHHVIELYNKSFVSV